MSLLPLAHQLLQVVPESMPLPLRLALWLKNPLLLSAYPRKMQATAEAVAAMSTDSERLRLLLTLQDEAKQLREKTTKWCPEDGPSHHEMYALFTHDHINGREREHLQKFMRTLCATEWGWLKAHVSGIIDGREAALEERREQDLWQHEDAA